jgi:hypothetical protein
MSKTRDTGFINNILKYDNDGNVSVVSGSTTLLFISSSGAIITTGIISGSNALSASYAVSASNSLAAATASYVLNGVSASYAASASNSISGAYAVNSTTASFSLTGTSASYAVNSTTASYAVGATNAANSTLFNNTASSVFATTGSNTLTGTQYVSNTNNAVGFSNTTSSIYTDGGLQVTKDAYFSSSMFIKGNLTVFGTQSVSFISSSQLNIGTNLITVNTDTPSIRFGGLAVYDSGSTGLTGSILWDSQNNHWVYTNPSGSSYSGGMLISGPRASSLGSEQGTTNNALMKGMGGDHITSSAVFEVSGSVGIGTSSPSYTLDSFTPSGSGTGNLGRFYYSDGTYNPRLQITGDSTGITFFESYSTGANTLKFSIAGSNTLVLKGDNVGIGTTNPSGLLQIGGSDSSGTLYVTASVNQNAVRLRNNNASFATIDIANADSTGYGIYAAGGKHYFSGNVGIGTTSLSEKLTVSGSIALVGNYSIKSDFEGVTFLQHNVSDGNFWTWQEQSAGWGHFVGNRNSQLNTLGGIMAGSGLGSFLTNSANGWSLAPLSGSSSAYATIAFDHNFGNAYFRGNVGIGTTSPTLANLQVNGSGNTTIGFIGASSMTTGQSAFFQVGKNQSANNNAGELSFKYVGDNDASNMVSLGFYGNGQKLNILKNGNVGIGTATPGYSLDISGSQSLLRIQSTSANFGSPSINLLQGAIDTVISATNNGLEIGTWSANDIIFKTTQVERARISTNGLKFQNGPSYLNYYDEGTWTPIFTFDSGSPYTGTTLRYIRIGKLLFLHGQTGCDTSGRSGGINITNLPFTLETGTGQGSNDCYLAIWGLNDNCYSYGYPGYSLNSTSLALYVHGGPSLGSARYFPLTVANCNLSTIYVSFMNTFVCA